jgi:hypothetical protein
MRLSDSLGCEIFQTKRGKRLNSWQLPLTIEVARKEVSGNREVIQLMEAQEIKLNKEPRLCVVRRFEGLIERASWVKSKRKGSLHAVGLVVALLIAMGLFGKQGK